VYVNVITLYLLTLVINCRKTVIYLTTSTWCLRQTKVMLLAAFSTGTNIKEDYCFTIGFILRS